MKTQVKLKICGVTTPEDAHALVQLGVHAIGINFWSQSKRYISPQDAQPFLEQIKGKIDRIGVFVNEDINTIKQLINNNLIDVAQLHGNESDAYCQDLADSNIEFIRVIKVQAQDTEITIPPIIGKRILLDTHVPGHGGAGQRFDWNLADQFIKNHPQHQIIIAGGITTQNIAEAATISPYMIDVASGAETSPGIKDMDKVKTMLSLLS